jgi:hypothetical protein
MVEAEIVRSQFFDVEYFEYFCWHLMMVDNLNIHEFDDSCLN